MNVSRIVASLVLCAGSLSWIDSLCQDPQRKPPDPAPATAKPVPEAKDADVESIDAILAALYESISGPIGEARDWDRFRSLFDADARLISHRHNDATDTSRTMRLTPDDYVGLSGAMLEESGFREHEIHRELEEFGEIAHAFSTYEGFYGAATEPAMRGVNSIQMVRRDGRWWIVSVFWQAESPGTPLPERYLPAKK